MTKPTKVYWDSCVWLGLINEESDKVTHCKNQIEKARKGEVEIWTSSLTRAEVFKVKLPHGITRQLMEEKDKAFEDFLDQDFVVEVALDAEIGGVARKLMRQYCPPLRKPNDAVHLASAITQNLDEFHTFDLDDLLPLDGKIQRSDGKFLKICKTPEPKEYQESLDFKQGAPDEKEADQNSVAE